IAGLKPLLRGGAAGNDPRDQNAIDRIGNIVGIPSPVGQLTQPEPEAVFATATLLLLVATPLPDRRTQFAELHIDRLLPAISPEGKPHIPARLDRGDHAG